MVTLDTAVQKNQILPPDIELSGPWQEEYLIRDQQNELYTIYAELMHIAMTQVPSHTDGLQFLGSLLKDIALSHQEACLTHDQFMKLINFT